MAQDDRNGTSIPIAPLVALLLFAGGMVVQHQPLDSDRPTSELRTLTVPHYGQDVEARLWQDPLKAVQTAARQEEGSSSLSINIANKKITIIGKEQQEEVDVLCGHPSAKCHKPSWLKNNIEVESKERTLVLPVMIFGGPYAEDSEDRRRNRYAVLSNLIDSGYQPIYSRGIGYVKFNNATAQRHGFPNLIPFERWDKMTGAVPATEYDHVFVLWLTEESFVPGAPEHLKDLFKQVLPSKGIEVKIIGPGSQETADELWPSQGKPDAAMSLCRDGKAAVWGNKCVDFLAPQLTSPITDSVPSALRFSPDDRTIVNTLVDELKNRRLSLRPSKDNCNYKNISGLDHIAIIVEADTHYGRSLEEEFQSALGCGEQEDKPKNLHVFRYFRGLDGKTSSASDEANKSSAPTNASAAKETTATQEKAQGQSQFDYLMRIASRVREQNDRLERKSREGYSPFNLEPSGRSIRAVVVLGSDIYDKLAILHALRERLPQAIFATSDLDAGFQQNDQLRWTRNLVVASGYDLRLHRHKIDEEDPQKGAPPFRDTYQTATFLATSMALSRSANDPDVEQVRNDALKNPRLFEIGDRTAVKLVPIDNQHKSQSKVGTAIRVVSVLVLVLLFGIAFSWCLRYLFREYWLLLIAATALVSVYTWRVVSVSSMPGEEPLNWLDGVSIWPSEFIRLFVVVLGIALLIYAQKQLRKGEALISNEFFQLHPSQSLPYRTWLEAWKALCARVCGNGRSRLRWVRLLKAWKALCRRVCPRLYGDTGRKSVRVKILWSHYRKWTSCLTVISRIAIGTALFFMLSIVMVSFNPVITPARGTASFLLNDLTIGAAGFVMVLVLVATLGRVAVSTLFLRCLYGDGAVAKPSDWDDVTLNHFCGVSCKASNSNTDLLKASKSYVDLMLSARMTELVSDIVLYPFVLTVLLFVARSPLFDNWVTPWGVMAVIGFGLGLVIISAWALRHSAERIRSYTLEQLINIEVHLRGGGEHDDKTCDPEKVRLMRDVVANLRTGAFAPLNEQPIVRALILPFGGAGVMSILEYLLMAKG